MATTFLRHSGAPRSGEPGIQTADQRRVAPEFRFRLRFAELAIGPAKGRTRWAPRNDNIARREISLPDHALHGFVDDAGRSRRQSVLP